MNFCNQNLIKYKYFVLIFVAILWCTEPCHCNVEFNRNSIGVSFSAYIHNIAENGLENDLHSYSLDDVKTMIKVISTRFSKVSSYDVGAGTVGGPYEENVTYSKSRSQKYSAEAAALVNKEMCGPNSKPKFPITMYIGVNTKFDAAGLELETKVAKESAEKANNIFPGTFAGLVFSGYILDSNVTHANQTLNQLKSMKHMSALKLGTRQICSGLDSSSNSDLSKIRKDIVRESDFIICEIYPRNDIPVNETFQGIEHYMNNYKQDLHDINSNIMVMLHTGLGHFKNDQNNLEILKEFWEKADRYSIENNITVWLQEAFDTPLNKNKMDFGWWKLTQDSEIGKLDGYLEKVLNVTADNSRRYECELTKKNISPSVVDGSKTGGVAQNRPTSVAFVMVTLILSATLF